MIAGTAAFALHSFGGLVQGYRQVGERGGMTDVEGFWRIVGMGLCQLLFGYNYNFVNTADS